MAAICQLLPKAMLKDVFISVQRRQLLRLLHSLSLLCLWSLTASSVHASAAAPDEVAAAAKKELINAYCKKWELPDAWAEGDLDLKQWDQKLYNKAFNKEAISAVSPPPTHGKGHVTLAWACLFKCRGLAEKVITQIGKEQAFQRPSLFWHPLYWAALSDERRKEYLCVNAPLSVTEGDFERYFHFLLDQDANVNARGKVGSQTYTLLRWAVEDGEMILVDLLLDQGANPDTKINREGPIMAELVHQAVEARNIERMKRLLKHKVDFNTHRVERSRASQVSPLWRAVQNRDFTMAEFLLKEAKADVAKGFGTAKQELIPPLFLAIQLAEPKMVKLLVTYGADVNERASIALGPCLYSTPAGEYTPLYYAVVQGDVEVVKLLLSHKDIQVNRPSTLLDSSTHSSLRRAVADRNLEILKAFFQDQDSGRKGRKLSAKHIENAKKQMDSRVEVDRKMLQLMEPEKQAKEESSAQPMLSAPALSPLFQALMNEPDEKRPNEVETLLNCPKTDVNQTACIEDGEYTPLYYAVMKGDVKVVKLLLSHEDINVNLPSTLPDGQKQRPLERAIQDNQRRIIVAFFQGRDAGREGRKLNEEDIKAATRLADSLGMAARWMWSLMGLPEKESGASKASSKKEELVDDIPGDFSHNRPVEKASKNLLPHHQGGVEQPFFNASHTPLKTPWEKEEEDKFLAYCKGEPIPGNIWSEWKEKEEIQAEVQNREMDQNMLLMAWAAYCGSTKGVNMLLDGGVPIGPKRIAWHPLYWALHTPDPDRKFIMFLREKGASVEDTGVCTTPERQEVRVSLLQYAAHIARNPKVTENLLQWTATPKTKSPTFQDERADDDEINLLLQQYSWQTHLGGKDLPEWKPQEVDTGEQSRQALFSDDEEEEEDSCPLSAGNSAWHKRSWRQREVAGLVLCLALVAYKLLDVLWQRRRALREKRRKEWLKKVGQDAGDALPAGA